MTDFGNADTVSRATLKEIHPELLRYPVMAVRCAVRGIESATRSPTSAITDNWADAATEFVENLCGDNVIRCSYVGAKLPNGALPVDLVVNGKSVAEELCRAGLAKSDSAGGGAVTATPTMGRKVQTQSMNNVRINTTTGKPKETIFFLGSGPKGPMSCRTQG